MGLLNEILRSLVDQGAPLGPVLLKVRYLASRIGSEPLEEWMRFESEGYPTDADLPEYRRVDVSYSGNFAGAFGSAIKNAPIPSYIVEKHAGEAWTKFEVRQGLEQIDDMLDPKNLAGGLYVGNTANLTLLLRGHIFPDYTPLSVAGEISKGGIIGIRAAVRVKIFDLVMQIEKKIPSAAKIEIGSEVMSESERRPDVVASIVQHIVHGNVTSINNSGSGSTFSFNISQGDRAAFTATLIKEGIPQDDAEQLADIVASERPEPGQALGPKAREWLAANIGKAVNGTWKIGLGVAEKVIAAAVGSYIGLG